MSVTVTIRNNKSFLSKNAPEMIDVHRYDCGCDGRGDCSICGGTAVFESSVLPFELQMANSNYHTFWSALGMDADEYAGSADPEIVLSILRTFDVSLVHRADSWIAKNILSCGISASQASRYVTALTEICEEAKSRGEDIVWS